MANLNEEDSFVFLIHSNIATKLSLCAACGSFPMACADLSHPKICFWIFVFFTCF